MVGELGSFDIGPIPKEFEGSPQILGLKCRAGIFASGEPVLFIELIDATNAPHRFTFHPVTTIQISEQTVPIARDLIKEAGLDPLRLPPEVLKHVVTTIEAGTATSSPFSFLPVPNDYLEKAGRVALSWSTFEQRFNALFDAVLKKQGPLPKDLMGWERRSWEIRQERLLQYAEKDFQQTPDFLAHLKKLIEQADNIQSQRNILLHGQMTTHFGGELKFAVTFRGRRKKQDVQATFTCDELQSLYEQTCGITGQIGGILTAHEDLPLPSSEISSLREYLGLSR